MANQSDPVLSGIRILAALAWFGAPAVGATLMGFPDPHFSFSFWPGALLCWVGGAATIIIGQEKIRAKEREGFLLIILALFGILLPIAGYFLARQDAIAKSTVSLDFAINIRCLSFGAPLPVDPENPIYIVGTFGPVPSPPGVFWPTGISAGYADNETDDLRPKGAYFRSVEKCTIFNRGTIPVADVLIDTGFHWHKLSPTNSEVMLEEDSSYKYAPFIVPSFDSEGKEANFYIVNFGPGGVSFTLPSTIKLHRAGNPKVETVSLQWLARSRNKVLFPPKGMTTKYLPDSPPVIPKLRESPERR